MDNIYEGRNKGGIYTNVENNMTVSQENMRTGKMVSPTGQTGPSTNRKGAKSRNMSSNHYGPDPNLPQ